MPNERSARVRGPFSSLLQLLEFQAERIPDAPAFLAPGRAPLTYAGLHRHVDKVGRTLRALGITPRERVAVVLPNGAEMAVAILSVAACAACAPVNPAYGIEELEAYFAELQPHALITLAGTDSAARRVARARDIRLIELSIASQAPAGLFELTRDRTRKQTASSAKPGNVALLLPTSGTTSRPKIVPQTHAHICTSAWTSASALALSETDRCLNVLPLFHGHGLTATVLASLAAGASVVCTPGFDVDSFPAWLTAFNPTWYSAVPTMHQAILSHRRHKDERLASNGLRFVRSSSAPLAPRVFQELERVFEAPVIEFYAMTETTSCPIACNPLPPGERKAGSVGVPVGMDVAIMDDDGTLLPRGRTAEIVVRGASVTAGYDNNPMATQAAFAGDWFRTGDVGFFDGDGYLFLTGRVREMINRGGEKISPREVDELLLDHPAVAEAATFAVPHASLGEDVASAVVLKPHCAATAKDIRRFASGRIADFKVPRQVLIVAELPKGPTGKVKRLSLAAQLGLADRGVLAGTFVAPRTSLEKKLSRIWATILQVQEIGIHDDFFTLGGDSLLATHILARIRAVFLVDVEIGRFFEAPTIADSARHIETLRENCQAQRLCSVIAGAAGEGSPPASIGQERLWQIQHALSDLPFFNILHALRLTTSVDLVALQRSITEIEHRHEVLRTTFAVKDGQHVQVIAPQPGVPFTFNDLHRLPKARKEKAAFELVQQEVLYAFDLANGPLLRTRLVRLQKREYLLLIAMHQIICDGWSLGVLVEELAALYEAFSAERSTPLTPPPIQYGDFARWQRQWRSHPDVVAQLAYWREQLSDPLPISRLAHSRSEPKRAIDRLRSARSELAWPAALSQRIKQFSQAEGVTLFMTLVAAFKTLLHLYTSQTDVRVATLVANRNRPGTERLIGPLVNTVILRTDVAGDPTPRGMLQRVRATTLKAFAHQDLPFEELVDTLAQERGLEPAAFAEKTAQVMIWLQTAALRPAGSCGQKLAFEEANPNMLVPLMTITKFDIVLMLRESGDGLWGICVYKPHLFSVKAIDRLLRDFQKVVEQMLARPERPLSAIRAFTELGIGPSRKLGQRI